MFKQNQEKIKELSIKKQSRDAGRMLIHCFVQTSLHLRAKCSIKKLDQLTAKISLSFWEICNTELYNVNEQEKQIFFNKFLFVICNTDEHTTIDDFLCKIIMNKSKIDFNINKKLFLYIDEPKNILLFLVIDFNETPTGKVNKMRSVGFNLVRASTKTIRFHSTLIKREIQELCMLYCMAVSE